MQVNADDVLLQFRQGVAGMLAGLGGKDVLGQAFDESAGAAGRIQGHGGGRVGNQFVHQGLAQPAGGVVFPHPAAFLRADGVLVQSGRQFIGPLRPVKLGHFAGHCPEVGAFPDFGRPLKEVGFDDAFQPGMAVQGSAIEQGGRVVFRFVDGVDAEMGLQDQGHQSGQVGVADVKPVGGFRVAGRVLAQGDLQQFLPEFPLDGHGGLFPMAVVGVFEQSGGLPEQIAVNAQVPGQGSGGREDVFGGGVDDGVKIFPQPGALPGPVKDLHRVGGQGQDVVADIALEVVAAVGKDAVLDAPAGLHRRQQIVVQLGGIGRVDAAVN